VRFQQVYDHSDFSLISTGGGWVTTIAFRGDESLGGGFGQVTNFQINLSTTPRGPDGLSSVFAENPGVDEKIVLGPSRAAMFSSPGDYLIRLSLTDPFFYNPAAGNLLMDIRNYSGIDYFGGMAFSLDAQSTVGDSVSSVYALNVNASSGTAVTGGLLTEFVVTPVPEPSTYALASLGTLLLLVGRRIQTKLNHTKGKGKVKWQ
jgi:hypothetical protein